MNPPTENPEVMPLEEVIATFEFDRFGSSPQRIEVRESESGYLSVIHCGDSETHMFGATLDQFGTWYDNGEGTIAAQEWGTRSFLSALISALGVLKAKGEVDTLPATQPEPKGEA